MRHRSIADESRMVVRVFNIKRLLLSVILGFLFPLGYAFLLSQASDYMGKTAPDFMVMPFGWPRPLWIYIMGRQPSESDLVGGIIFMAVCDTLLYVLIVYASLLLISISTRKPIVSESMPPPPQDFRSGSE